MVCDRQTGHCRALVIAQFDGVVFLCSIFGLLH